MVKSQPHATHRKFIINIRFEIINQSNENQTSHKQNTSNLPIFFAGFFHVHVDVVIRTFRPKNPAVNAHHGVVNINEHIAQQSENVHNVNEQNCGDDSGRIDPNIFSDGEINTQQTENGGNRFQKNLVSFVGIVRFEKKIMEIHAFKDNNFGK